MAFTVAIGSAGRILFGNITDSTPCTSLSHLALLSSSSTTTRRRNFYLVSAKKQPSSRSKKDRPDTTTTTTTTITEEDLRRQRNAEVENYFRNADYLPKLPGTKPDFFEGPQWNTVGFIFKYLWVVGIVLGVIAGLLGAIQYNQGATDFKETPAYKESVQSKELFEQPEESDSDVFDSNPTEVAPSLD